MLHTDLLETVVPIETWQQAEQLLASASGSDPRAVKAIGALVDTYMDAGDLNAAMRLMDFAVTRFPLQSAYLKRLGIVSYQLGAPDIAEACFLRALTRDSSDLDALTTLGFLASQAGRPREAYVYYRLALQAGTDLDAVIGLAEVAHALGDSAMVRRAHALVLELDPHHPQLPDLEGMAAQASESSAPHAILAHEDVLQVLRKLVAIGMRSDPSLSPYDLQNLLEGVEVFAQTETTPEAAYQSLIRLFCLTQGRSNDVMSSLVSILYPPYELPKPDGLLGGLSGPDIERIVSAIAEEGYYIFPHRLPEALCNQLVNFALTEPAVPSPPREGLPKYLKYDPTSPVAEAYKFEEQVLIDSGLVQEIVTDPSVLAIAQAYLGSQPLLDIIAMWWSTAQVASLETNVELARLYHFDMDRLKWLKFFFYLTDVTTETGPHCYVRGSHRIDGQPLELLKRGYVRIPDADIERAYPVADRMEINGPRGTILAVDTRGFHKGKPLVTGDRLVFQWEYCNSLFGGSYTRRPPSNIQSPRFREFQARFPRLFAKFS